VKCAGQIPVRKKISGKGKFSRKLSPKLLALTIDCIRKTMNTCVLRVYVCMCIALQLKGKRYCHSTSATSRLVLKFPYDVDSMPLHFHTRRGQSQFQRHTTAHLNAISFSF